MAELSPREHQILDMILYLRHQLAHLLPETQAAELESFLASHVDNYDEPLSSALITRLLQEIRDYEPVRARLEQLSGTYLLSYTGPAQPLEEAPIIPLGEMVVCPKKEGHDGIEPYMARLRKQGQRCPIHDIYLIPGNVKKD